jgi:hypothetical protein
VDGPVSACLASVVLLKAGLARVDRDLAGLVTYDLERAGRVGIDN